MLENTAKLSFFSLCLLSTPFVKMSPFPQLYQEKTSTRPCHHCSIRESLLSEGCWWHCCGVPREPQRQEEVNMTLLNSQGSGMRRYIDLGVKRFFLKSMYIKDIYKKFMENQGRHLVQQLRRCLRCPRPILVLGFKYQLCSIF